MARKFVIKNQKNEAGCFKLEVEFLQSFKEVVAC